jgi:hypothetical protein
VLETGAHAWLERRLSVQPYGPLGFTTFDVPPVSPIFMTDCATWIWIFAKALAGFSGSVALVVLPLSTAQPYGALGFIIFDVPAAAPVFMTDCAARIEIVGKALSGFSGQLTLVLPFMGVRRRHFTFGFRHQRPAHLVGFWVAVPKGRSSTTMPPTSISG